jgi:hypothetical protein
MQLLAVQAMHRQVLVQIQVQCLHVHAAHWVALVVRVARVLVAQVVPAAVHVQAVLVAAQVLQAQVAAQVLQVELHVQVLLAVAVKQRVHSVAAVSQARLASQSALVVKSSTISQPRSLVVCKFNSVVAQLCVCHVAHHLQTSQRRLARTQQHW